MSSATSDASGNTPSVSHPPGHARRPADIDLLRVDDQLTSDERLVRDTVRDFAADRVEPYIADGSRRAPCHGTSCPNWANWACSACT